MKDVVLSMFDLTGNMVKPWVEAGYTAVIVDMQHPHGMNDAGGGNREGRG